MPRIRRKFRDFSKEKKNSKTLSTSLFIFTFQEWEKTGLSWVKIFVVNFIRLIKKKRIQLIKNHRIIRISFEESSIFRSFLKKIYLEQIARHIPQTPWSITLLFLATIDLFSRGKKEKERKRIEFDEFHHLLRRKNCLSFDLWFLQFTIFKPIPIVERFRSLYTTRWDIGHILPSTSEEKRRREKKWKYAIGISNHWNYWNPAGNLGKTELEKVIIPTAVFFLYLSFRYFFSSSSFFLPSSLFFFSSSFQKEYREGGREGEKEVVLHRLAISNP